MQDTMLRDLRVLDFGAFMAGPVAGMLMAHLGAEVIKIENPKRPDGTRFFVTAPKSGVKPPDPRLGTQLYDTANFNKLGTCIDLASPEAKKLMRGLVEQSDVFIENMAPGTMAKLGLGYDQVRAWKPDIIYLSSSACGQYGPEKNYIGYAATFACKVGLSHLTGYPGSIPSTFVASIDLRSAVTATVAILAALHYRDKTGQGQFIDLASQEAIAAQLGDVYLDYAANGVIQGPRANRRAGYAPQGAYPALGEDQWVTISVAEQTQWEALCRAMDRPELAHDLRFASYADRQEHWEALDQILSDWTAPQDKYAVAHRLQAAGVPAGPVLNSEGLFKDPHMRRRECFVPVEHPDMGTDYSVGIPWRSAEGLVRPIRRSPILGEHTTQVLKNVLGMEDGEIQTLAEQKVIHRLFD